MHEVNPRRRAVLCVPAGDDHRLGKAIASRADEVVVDLEDAVAPDRKAAAREQVARFEWPGELPTVAVRVNAIGTAWCHRDLEAVAAMPRVTSVVVPKVESRSDLGFVERLLTGLEAEVGRREPLRVQVLVETAAGIADLAGITSDVRRLSAVIVGYADLAASLGRPRDADPTTWRGVQDAVVIHARAAGVAAVDGPFLGTAADASFRRSVDLAVAAGFDGTWVIHPRQVGGAIDAFTPPERAVEHAHRVLETLAAAHGSGVGAAVLDGALVDEAMARDARRVLVQAGAL
jgi:citrate lyase subunit beta/citryl-CoA lyase